MTDNEFLATHPDGMGWSITDYDNNGEIKGYLDTDGYNAGYLVEKPKDKDLNIAGFKLWHPDTDLNQTAMCEAALADRV